MPANHNEEKLLAMACHIKESYQPAEITQLVRLISPAPSTGQMSAEAFERVMKVMESQGKRRAYSPKSMIAARLVLVMGASISEAAAEAGLARQVVHRLMQRLSSRMASFPQDWVIVSEWFPGEVAKQLEDISASLKELHAAGQPIEGLTYRISLDAPAA